jgi:hypothetical protein
MNWRHPDLAGFPGQGEGPDWEDLAGCSVVDKNLEHPLSTLLLLEVLWCSNMFFCSIMFFLLESFWTPNK